MKKTRSPAIEVPGGRPEQGVRVKALFVECCCCGHKIRLLNRRSEPGHSWNGDRREQSKKGGKNNSIDQRYLWLVHSPPSLSLEKAMLVPSLSEGALG